MNRRPAEFCRTHDRAAPSVSPVLECSIVWLAKPSVIRSALRNVQGFASTLTAAPVQHDKAIFTAITQMALAKAEETGAERIMMPLGNKHISHRVAAALGEDPNMILHPDVRKDRQGNDVHIIDMNIERFVARLHPDVRAVVKPLQMR